MNSNDDVHETFCTGCGADETGAVTVEKERLESTTSTGALDLMENYRTTIRCANCGIEETVGTGLLPESHTDNFGYRRPAGDSETKLLVDGQRVHFRDIDENIVESALIRNEGVTATSRAHHLHVHAWNAPTLTQGNAHRVQIAGYLDQKMMLTGIRYHDDKNRTLKFVRGLDDGAVNKLESIRGEASAE